MKGRILIIDDDVHILDELSLFLRRHGFEVLTAALPAVGLEIFLQKEVDLVLLDMRMPGMDGRAVMDAIRQTDPYTQIILISGTIHNRDALELLSAGAFTFFSKPLDLFFLKHTIERGLEFTRLKKELAQLKGETI
ncbi:MAG: response regulator [Spirochaetales bacterium]|nr:response regulator [Spirochaetales bacterium]